MGSLRLSSFDDKSLRPFEFLLSSGEGDRSLPISTMSAGNLTFILNLFLSAMTLLFCYCFLNAMALAISSASADIPDTFFSNIPGSTSSLFISSVDGMINESVSEALNGFLVLASASSIPFMFSCTLSADLLSGANRVPAKFRFLFA